MVVVIIYQARRKQFDIDPANILPPFHCLLSPFLPLIHFRPFFFPSVVVVPSFPHHPYTLTLEVGPLGGLGSADLVVSARNVCVYVYLVYFCLWVW